MLDRLVTVADLAARGLTWAIVPTLFTGHMSGVNWFPAWALGGSEHDRPLPGGVRVAGWSRRRPSQLVQPIRGDRQGAGVAGWGEAAAALAGHEATLGMGSRQRKLELCRYRRAGRLPEGWLGANHHRDPRSRPGPCWSLSACTWKTWRKTADLDQAEAPENVRSALDARVLRSRHVGVTAPPTNTWLPFLAHITRWLGEGRDVLFSEFGLPTYRAGDQQSGKRAREASPRPSSSKSRPRLAYT